MNGVYKISQVRVNSAVSTRTRHKPIHVIQGKRFENPPFDCFLSHSLHFSSFLYPKHHSKKIKKPTLKRSWLKKVEGCLVPKRGFWERFNKKGKIYPFPPLSPFSSPFLCPKHHSKIKVPRLSLKKVEGGLVPKRVFEFRQKG